MNTMNEGQPNRFEIFWGEIAPCEHLVQIYSSDGPFMDSLEGFVAGGIKAGDSVIVIATEAHLSELQQRLLDRGMDLNKAKLIDQYIPFNADKILMKFLVEERIDQDLFEEFITEAIKRARGNGRKVRAFGEMVAILWAQGFCGATVQLEHLWHTYCREQDFSLFCAYPKVGFTQDTTQSMNEICAAHSKVIEP